MPRQRKLPSGMVKRGSVYYAAFRRSGRLIRKRLSSDFKAAAVMLNDLKARADLADFDLLDNNVQIEDLKVMYLRHCEQTLRPSTVQRYRENLDQITKALAVGKVSQITISLITTYRTERLADKFDPKTKKQRTGASPRTVNMEVGALGTLLTWAVKHKFIGSNPLVGIKPLSNDEKRKERRALSAEEVSAIFAHSPEYLKPVWRMFATTGLRHDELVGLKFEDVDMEHGIATVRQGTAKNHKAREVPLDDVVLEQIRELSEQAKHRKPMPGQTAKMTELLKKRFSKDHVFVTTKNTPLDSNLLAKFYRVCRKAGIEDAKAGGAVDIHSLRVTFTTLAIEGGASPKAVQAILGHSTLGMTMGIYAKATERAKRSAVAALPFATCTAPDHVVSMEDVRKARANQNGLARPDDTSGVA